MSCSPKHKGTIKANISNYTIINSDKEKLLGKTIDNHLKLSHIYLWSRAIQKLYALSRVSLYMSLNQRRDNAIVYYVSVWSLSISMDEPQPSRQ